MTHAAAAVIRKSDANPYFARAIDTEEYRTAVALRKQAVNRRTKCQRSTRQPSRPSPANSTWLEAVTNARGAEHTRELQYAALTSLVGNCDARIVATVDLESNEILRSLSTELDALLADVSVAVPRLTGARTPSEVLAAGVKVSAVWNDELRPLRDKYDQLRDAQKFVEGSEISCHGSDYVWGDPHCSRLYIRNIDDIFAGWKSPDISRVNLSGVPSDPRPWPDHPVAQLVWFATNNAQLWIPTREDMRILERELHIRNNPQPAVIPGRPDKLRKKPIGTIY